MLNKISALHLYAALALACILHVPTAHPHTPSIPSQPQEKEAFYNTAGYLHTLGVRSAKTITTYLLSLASLALSRGCIHICAPELDTDMRDLIALFPCIATLVAYGYWVNTWYTRHEGTVYTVITYSLAENTFGTTYLIIQDAGMETPQWLDVSTLPRAAFTKLPREVQKHVYAARTSHTSYAVRCWPYQPSLIPHIPYITA